MSAVAAAPPDAGGLDPHARRFLAMMAAGPAVEAQDLSLPLPGRSCPARLYVPPNAPATGPGVVFFHGGELVTGDLDTHDAICRRLCATARCRVLAAAYRLAPEHPYPAAIENAVAVVAHVAATAERYGIARGRLAVCCDSAGADLAARVCQEMRGPPIAAQLLICPVLDLGCGSASYRDFASGYFLDAATVRDDIAVSGVAALVAEPRVSPLREPDLAGLPPAHIHTAAFDVVPDEGESYARRLAASGVPVDYRCHADMIHFFCGLGRLVPRSAPILDGIGAGFATLLGSVPPAALATDQRRRPS